MFVTKLAKFNAYRDGPGISAMSRYVGRDATLFKDTVADPGNAAVNWDFMEKPVINVSLFQAVNMAGVTRASSVLANQDGKAFFAANQFVILLVILAKHIVRDQESACAELAGKERNANSVLYCQDVFMGPV